MLSRLGIREDATRYRDDSNAQTCQWARHSTSGDMLHCHPDPNVLSEPSESKDVSADGSALWPWGQILRSSPRTFTKDSLRMTNQAVILSPDVFYRDEGSAPLALRVDSRSKGVLRTCLVRFTSAGRLRTSCRAHLSPINRREDRISVTLA